MDGPEVDDAVATHLILGRSTQPDAVPRRPALSVRLRCCTACVGHHSPCTLLIETRRVANKVVRARRCALVTLEGEGVRECTE